MKNLNLRKEDEDHLSEAKHPGVGPDLCQNLNGLFFHEKGTIMKTIKAQDLREGDTIQVNFGMGNVGKTVDEIQSDSIAGSVTVRLFADFGRRHKIVLPFAHLVLIEERPLES